jgi:predicted nucleic acid binding AN1-type Zn finger protein
MSTTITNSSNSSKRCSMHNCKRKLTIVDMECKCKKRYCLEHRLPEQHNCCILETAREMHQQYLKEHLLDAKFVKLEEKL